MLRVTLVRHGEVAPRHRGRYNGHVDIPLGDAGKRQARTVARCLAHEPFDAVYCSDLSRCRETLEPLLPSLPVKPVYTALLREKSWGRHEGMNYDEIVTRDGLVYRSFSQWVDALDGERIKAFRRRVDLFFHAYLPQTGCSNVLIVTHAGVIRILQHLSLGIDLETAFTQPIPCGGVIEYDMMTAPTYKERRCDGS